MLSVIIPSYNEEQVIPITAGVIADILSKENINYELIFINDGSKDRTWEVICRQAESNPGVRGISFSRHFGKEAAIFAGLAEVRGDCVLVIDCDLQHPPEKIPEMYRLWQEGYDVVEGVKSSRGKESGFHKKAAQIFYKLISRATDIDMSRASDFKLMDRRVTDKLLEMPEKKAFFRAVSSWVGYRKTQVEFDVRERVAGESKWSTGALIKYAISNITAYSTFPVQFTSYTGIGMIVAFIVLGIFAICIGAGGDGPQGRFLGLLSFMFFIGGIICVCLGIVGYYVARTYEEAKGRPRYIIATRTEDKVM